MGRLCETFDPMKAVAEKSNPKTRLLVHTARGLDVVVPDLTFHVSYI